jgi:predicted nuclease with TOPRIM domain
VKIMTRRQTLAAAALAIVIAASAFAVRAFAQAPAFAAERRFGEAGSQSDILPALLQEVHGLRAAMEQMATSNAHAQLLVGRLQLQEGRMNGMIRRLDTIRDERAKAQTEYDQIRGSLQMLENQHEPGEVPEQDKEGLLAGLKQHVTAVKANVDRLGAEEAQLTSDLTAEQGRWIDINQRLDELERSLGKR